MIVLSPRTWGSRTRGPRAALALVAGSLLLLGATGCGSTGDTAADPDPSPAAVVTPGTTDTETPADSGTPAPGETATASPTEDGAAPASITIESPDNGTSVSTTLTVSGTANSPEANVPWRIDSPTDGVLVSGFATADGWLDKAYPWTTSVDVSALQPGTYTFTARVDDDSNGEGTKPPSATITFVKK